MTKKSLDKQMLSEMIAGTMEERLYSDVIDTEEVKALMYSQWKNPEELKSESIPNFKTIFQKIKEGALTRGEIISSSTKYLVSEIELLKTNTQKLRRKYSIVFAAAASIALLFTVGALMFLQQNKVMQESYTESIVPKGQKSQLILPDGTHVYLNSGSVLRYNNKFGKKYRKLEMSGEGYFEVVSDKSSPFIITTKDVEVRVVGTKFNVSAYPEDDFVETTVTEGQVAMTELHGNSNLLISMNQKATYHKNTQLLLLNDVNPHRFVAWKENMLAFDNENFANVIKKLERWYDVSINVEGIDSLEDRFTLTINHESLREVLELISLTTEIEYTLKDDKVSIIYN